MSKTSIAIRVDDTYSCMILPNVTVDSIAHSLLLAAHKELELQGFLPANWENNLKFPCGVLFRADTPDKYVALAVFTHPRTNHLTALLLGYVIPELRRSGIASWAIQFAERLTAQVGGLGVVAGVHRFNALAHKLFTAHEYQPEYVEYVKLLPPALPAPATAPAPAADTIDSQLNLDLTDGQSI